jgi:hypothetical protein
MPLPITDDATQFPAVTTPAGSDVPNAASVQTFVQQLANRTAYLKALLLVPPPWTPSTVVQEGSIRSNGANVYLCNFPGTTAGSGGPTGTTLAADITDNTAHWYFICTLASLGIFNLAPGGSAPGAAFTGGPNGAGIQALPGYTGGAGQPVRGAINIPWAMAPSAPQQGDLWWDSNGRLAIQVNLTTTWTQARSNETFWERLTFTGQIPATANAQIANVGESSTAAWAATSGIGISRAYMASAGVIQHIQVVLSAAPGGTGIDFVIWKNGVSTGITISIAAGATSAISTANTGPTFVAGDYLEFRVGAAAHTNGAINAHVLLGVSRTFAS